jgi:hypothetical protein
MKLKKIKIPTDLQINEAAKIAELKARHSDSVFDGFHYGVEWLLKEICDQNGLTKPKTFMDPFLIMEREVK